MLSIKHTQTTNCLLLHESFNQIKRETVTKSISMEILNLKLFFCLQNIDIDTHVQLI